MIWRLMFVLMAVAVAGSAAAQQATLHDPLLDHMAGTWVAEGTIAGKPTTHDITGEWVLKHQYLRLHEVSREKDADGKPFYEAMIFIGWDQTQKAYAAVWLDDYGDVAPQSLANATRTGEAMPFVFKDPDGSITRTTMTYLPGADRWTWTIDEDDKGKTTSFARLMLRRP